MKEHHLILFAEDGYDDEECPVCGEPFDTDVWEMTSHGGDAWGGQANYDCPNCEKGHASLNY